jgi:murein DD-endopeptidase MepM/ murein hydrolase activator NlpD
VARPPLTVAIREGQSLWSLAAEYGTTVDAIVAANGLSNARTIRTGTSVVIPGATAAKPASKKSVAKTKPGTKTVVVRIYNGQTVWDVAQAYGVSVEEIVAANGLSSPDFVRAGQRLVVPVQSSALSPRRVAAAIAESAGSVASSAVVLAQGFIWPARGRLSSGFGWRRLRHHDGIDIAAPYGAPITAARDGTVVFAGWYYAYGKTVIVSHGNGLQTIYGHASRVLVQRGDQVKKGELIAHVGSTGRSTGPHLHFEVRINGRAVNPMKYL